MPLPRLKTAMLTVITFPAAERYPHYAIRSGTDCLSSMVLGQLLPHGIYRPSISNLIWRSPGNGVDVRIEV